MAFSVGFPLIFRVFLLVLIGFYRFFTQQTHPKAGREKMFVVKKKMACLAVLQMAAVNYGFNKRSC